MNKNKNNKGAKYGRKKADKIGREERKKMIVDLEKQGI